MGKKRKVLSQAYNDRDQIAKVTSSKLVVNTYEDVADSEDEFLDNRDRILLDEGPDAKRRRKVQAEGMDTCIRPTAELTKLEQALEASDEEVLGLPESDNDSDDDDEGENSEALEEEGSSEDENDILFGRLRSRPGKNGQDLEDDEDGEGWGDLKQDYYGADAIDTEQAALDEEAEAKRLQQKQLESMSNTDMLFAEHVKSEAQDDHDVSEDGDEVVTERLPELEIAKDLSEEERLKLLKLWYPELESIARDWLTLHELRDEAQKDTEHVPKILQLRASLGMSRDEESHIALIRYTALSAYLAACAMYFAVLTSTANGTPGVLSLPPRKLREHPVIQNVLESRQRWEEIQRHPRADTAAELAGLERRAARTEKGTARSQVEADMQLTSLKPKPSSTKLSTTIRKEEAQQAASEARRKERMRKVEAELADLSELVAKRQRKASTKANTLYSAKPVINEEDSDLGDEGVLTAQELAAKAARKKSLKFYTSQIAQKANKQGSRSRDYGGDLDVPYRERLKDREARLNAAAERRGRQPVQPGEQLGDGSSDDEVLTNGGQNGQLNGDEDYYDMVAARSKQKKADKQAAADAYAEAKRQNAQVFEVEEVGADGKRKISYQIEKNKGLTPHRKKEVRNPRVKKKLKYASKLKKLGSTRQVYKGGEHRGGYGGELSGIKTGLVKSVKL